MTSSNDNKQIDDESGTDSDTESVKGLKKRLQQEDDDQGSDGDYHSERLTPASKKARIAEIDGPVFAENVADDAERNTALVICGVSDAEESNVFMFTPEVHLTKVYQNVYLGLVTEGGADLSYPRTIKERSRLRLINALMGIRQEDGKDGDSDYDFRVEANGALITGKSMRVINVCF